jgi:hypothetical protein
MFKIQISVNPDVEIPDHVYDEAVELYLNHLKTHCEAQVNKGENLHLLCENQGKHETICSLQISPWYEYYGKVYKTEKDLKNAVLARLNRKPNTRLRSGCKTVDY